MKFIIVQFCTTIGTILSKMWLVWNHLITLCSIFRIYLMQKVSFFNNWFFIGSIMVIIDQIWTNNVFQLISDKELAPRRTYWYPKWVDFVQFNSFYCCGQVILWVSCIFRRGNNRVCVLLLLVSSQYLFQLSKRCCFDNLFYMFFIIICLWVCFLLIIFLFRTTEWSCPPFCFLCCLWNTVWFIHWFVVW